MTKYVIGYLNFFDNQLKLEIVEAHSAFDAAINYLGSEWSEATSSTLEDLQEELYNGDTLIEVLELS